MNNLEFMSEFSPDIVAIHTVGFTITLQKLPIDYLTIFNTVHYDRICRNSNGLTLSPILNMFPETFQQWSYDLPFRRGKSWHILTGESSANFAPLERIIECAWMTKSYILL